MTAEEFTLLLQRVYRQFGPALDFQHGRSHCREVAHAGQVLADALGIRVVMCQGTRRLDEPKPYCLDGHAWLELPDGRILHCYKRGEVELRWPHPGEFAASWRSRT